VDLLDPRELPETTPGKTEKGSRSQTELQLGHFTRNAVAAFSAGIRQFLSACRAGGLLTASQFASIL
jgi:hypothetical protein